MGIRVLILEPDKQLLESFQDYFARMTDFEVQVTSDGQDCVEKLGSFSPQVLVMEPALPYGTAELVLDSINDSRDVVFVPVLVLTRFSREASLEHPCIQEFLVKPQSLADIAQAIRRLAMDGPACSTK